MADLILQRNAQYFCEELVGYLLYMQDINWSRQRTFTSQRLSHLAINSFIPAIGQGIVYTSFRFQRDINNWSTKILSLVNSYPGLLRRSLMLYLMLGDIAPIFTYDENNVLLSFIYMTLVINFCTRSRSLFRQSMIEIVVRSLMDYFILTGEFAEVLQQLHNYAVEYLLPE